MSKGSSNGSSIMLSSMTAADMAASFQDSAPTKGFAMFGPDTRSTP
ncbi:hypothetical protein G9U51_15730 [Calidifontibacter sp. DB0510]|uniref:Uncharacterized protein n=1 Tax=Metallococcus carri TaxID=1656884 RepID=A0A967B7W7_9MICO|nr:hypothetical protein [Metallococcus carri]NHN57222.1 hypothetical protein [Metallococcus carri]NOP37975.1 hypothetical protein [Calidifontibacter sp. DB2511S]